MLINAATTQGGNKTEDGGTVQTFTGIKYRDTNVQVSCRLSNWEKKSAELKARIAAAN